jgi:hypothetical protein
MASAVQGPTLSDLDGRITPTDPKWTWDNLVALKRQLDEQAATLSNVKTDYMTGMSTYVINMGGIVNANTPSTLSANITTITTALNRYTALSILMNTRLKELRNGTELSTLFSSISTKNSEFNEKLAVHKALEEDVQTQRARKEAVERATKDASYDQLFGGISRPIRPVSIPILLVLSVIFFIVGVYVIYKVLTFREAGGLQMLATQVGGAFKNRRVR